MNVQETTSPASVNFGRVMALSSAMLLGMNTTLARVAYDGGANSTTVLGTRVAVCSISVGILIFLMRGRFAVPRQSILPLIGIGVAMAFQGVAYLSSVAYIPVGLAVLLFYTYPLMVAAYSRIFDGLIIGTRRLGAFAAAFIGIGLAVGPSFETLDLFGVVLALIGAVGITFIFIFSARALRHTDSLTAAFYGNLTAIPPIVLFLPFVGGFQLPETEIGWYGLTGVCLCYALAILGQFGAINVIGKTPTALLSNIEPLVSIGAAALILGESLSGQQYVGAMIVVIALFASDTLPARNQKAEAEPGT